MKQLLFGFLIYIFHKLLLKYVCFIQLVYFCVQFLRFQPNAHFFLNLLFYSFPLVKISTSCIYDLLMNIIYEFLLQFRDSIKVHGLLHLLHCRMFHYKTFNILLLCIGYWFYLMFLFINKYTYLKNVVITIFILISFTFLLC